MKSRPILFKAEMVRAILEGRKNQTRRIVKAPAGILERYECQGEWEQNEFFSQGGSFPFRNGAAVYHAQCPFGQPGDRLWIKETYALNPDEHPAGAGIIYRATNPSWDDKNTGLKWEPSLFMPQKYSRITLEVTQVRVQRLQDITPSDAIAEGIAPVSLAQLDCESRNPVDGFRNLWESINGPGSWSLNPWVFAVFFNPCEKCVAS